MQLRSFIPLSLLLAIVVPTGGSVLPTMAERETPAFMEPEATRWADSVLTSLSLEQQVAQLMMVAAWSNKDAKHEAYIERLVKEEYIGGLIFFQGGPARQAALTNRYQAAASTGLLIGMDLEWGFDMRLDSTFRFPRQMTLGALEDDRLIESMGAEIAEQMKRLGVHVSFSPVADVNNNPGNPVINERSFGEDREKVSDKAIAYMKGLQDAGVIATGKHFPGHGDTDKDSHKTLPLILHDRNRLDSLELYPFKKMIGSGLMAMMVAHLEIPALDSAANTPTTLSHFVVTDLLKKKLGFSGLVFTDAMNMRGVADVGEPGDLELRALKAGNDILLFPQDPEIAIDRIVRAARSGELDSNMIARKCLRVLRAKRWVGLNEFNSIAIPNIHAEMNPKTSEDLRQKIFDEAMTVLRNKGDIIPLFATNKKKITLVTIGAGKGDVFAAELQKNADMEVIPISKQPSESDIPRVLRQVESSDIVLVGIHGTNRSPKEKFGVSSQSMKLVRMINDRKPTIVSLFGNPYRLDSRSGMDAVEGLIVGYEDVPEAHISAAALLFGSTTTNAKLPVTIAPEMKAGDGISSILPTRMIRSTPEAEGINGAVFEKVDSIVYDGIKKKAFPGAQVLVAKNGNIIFEKSYGSPTYDAIRDISSYDVYDLASITKVAATTLSLMHLRDQGKFNPDEKIGNYLPELLKDHPQYANLIPRDMLTHQSGLKSWIPFYWKMLEDGKRKPGLIHDQQQRIDDVEVAERVFIPKLYQDSIMPWILSTELRERRDYKYSDLGYYFFQRIIEKISGLTLDQYVHQNFYRPMGLRRMGYYPLNWSDKSNVIPTEYDAVWREGLVQGTVHDPGAAMLGGVGGHAGLFSNAEDLAAIMQLFVNGGTYGGSRFLSEEVITEFTNCQYCTGDKKENRRGMGFDKPYRHGEGGPTFDGVPYSSFGHSGFTGTLAWADPENDLVYIFLSNRVYPTADNKKLIRMDIRTKIQEAIYEGLPEEIAVEPELIAQPLPDNEVNPDKALSKKEQRRLKKEQRKEIAK